MTVEQVTFDFGDLCIDELDLIEQLTGKDLDALSGEDAKLGTTELRAFAYVAKHRESPVDWPVDTEEQRRDGMKRAGRFGTKFTSADAEGNVVATDGTSTPDPSA
jgi:hypothetical protein